MSAAFANLQILPPDPLFGLSARFKADTRPFKVDLGIGAYRDNAGKPWVLPSVRMAEAQLHKDPLYNHEYLPIAGYEPFVTASAKVILGSQSAALRDQRVVSVQTLSGTGALHVAAAFLKSFYTGAEHPVVYLSAPTWANHTQIFESAGIETKAYPYWNARTKSLDLEGYLNAINTAPRGSIFVLHACAHNPTGLDPTPEQWKQLIQALNANNHLSVYDSAYQGFASGSLEKDAWAVRHAVAAQATQPIFICQSFAKNVGMYGERAGAIHVVTPKRDAELNSAISTNLQKITRSELSNPPAYGSKVVATVLNTPEFYAQWEKDLVTMSSRIATMRHALKKELEALGTPGSWNHIVEQQGMFSFTGLAPPEVQRLEKTHAVYLVGSGRVSVAGLNQGNVQYVAKAINEVVVFFHKQQKL